MLRVVVGKIHFLYINHSKKVIVRDTRLQVQIGAQALGSFLTWRLGSLDSTPPAGGVDSKRPSLL